MTALLLALSLCVARPPAPTYVALGDSTGVGVGARRGGGYPARLARRLERAGHPVRLVNLCASGARVADVAARQLRPALAARPAVVTLAVGINDAVVGTDPDAFERDYDRVTTSLLELGAPLLVANVPDLSRSPLAVGEEARRSILDRVAVLNARIAAVAQRKDLPLVDLFAETARDLPGHPELLAEDRFHPSALGYERWADAMQPGLIRALAVAAPRLDNPGPGR